MIRVYLCFAILFILPLNARAADGPREPLPAGAKFRLGSDLFKNNVGFMWKYGTLAPDDKGLLCPKRLEDFDLATGRGSKWHAADALKDRWLEGEPQYSADAQRLLTADRDRYRVWDVATNRELLAVERKFGFDSVGLLSADGAKLAAIVKGKTVVWDVATGKAAPELTYPAMEFAEVGLSPDGKTLAVSGRRNFKMALQLWDTEKGKELAILNGPSGMPSSPAFAARQSPWTAASRSGSSTLGPGKRSGKSTCKRRPGTSSSTRRTARGCWSPPITAVRRSGSRRSRASCCTRPDARCRCG